MKSEVSPILRRYLEQHGLGDITEVDIDDAAFAEACSDAKSQHPEENLDEIWARAAFRLVWEERGVIDSAATAKGTTPVEEQSGKRIVEIQQAVKKSLPDLAVKLDAINSSVSSSITSAADAIQEAIKSQSNRLTAISVTEKIDADRRSDAQAREFYAQAKKVLKWVVGWGIAVLILLSVIAVRAHGQIEVIKFQQDGVAVKTFAAPFTINCTVNVTCSISGGKLTINSSGGSGTTPTGTGFTHITAGVQDAASKTVDVSSADVTGTLAAARFGALTGDVTNSAGSYATTVVKIQGTGVSSTAPAKYMSLRYDGTNWLPTYNDVALSSRRRIEVWGTQVYGDPQATATTENGTASFVAPAATEPLYRRLQTTAVAGTVGASRAVGTVANSPYEWGKNSIYSADLALDEVTSAASQGRYYWGVTSTTPSNYIVNDSCVTAGSFVCIGFQFSISRGDTAVQCLLSKGSGQTTATTGVSLSAAVGKVFMFWEDTANTTVHFYTVSNAPTPVLTEVCAGMSMTNYPAANTILAPSVAVYNGTEALAHGIRFSFVSLSWDAR